MTHGRDYGQQGEFPQQGYGQQYPQEQLWEPQPDDPDGHQRKREIPSWIKVSATVCGFVITTVIAASALWLSYQEKSAQDSAKKLADEQSQQIAELQATTPVGKITGMVAYRPDGHMATISGMRNVPVLRQQIYNLSGTASDVPDNGSLFMVVHDHGQPTPYFSNPSNHFYVTHVMLSSKNDNDQYWHAGGVYTGESSAPDTPLSYRLTLYFCNSVDAAKIAEATTSSAARNYGLQSLPYPSCEQLDSIFVTRGLRDLDVLLRLLARSPLHCTGAEVRRWRAGGASVNRRESRNSLERRLRTVTAIAQGKSPGVDRGVDRHPGKSQGHVRS